MLKNAKNQQFPLFVTLISDYIRPVWKFLLVSVALNLKQNQQTKSKNVTDLHKDTGKAYILMGSSFNKKIPFSKSNFGSLTFLSTENGLYNKFPWNYGNIWMCISSNKLVLIKQTILNHQSLPYPKLNLMRSNIKHTFSMDRSNIC